MMAFILETRVIILIPLNTLLKHIPLQPLHPVIDRDTSIQRNTLSRFTLMCCYSLFDDGLQHDMGLNTFACKISCHQVCCYVTFLLLIYFNRPYISLVINLRNLIKA